MNENYTQGYGDCEAMLTAGLTEQAHRVADGLGMTSYATGFRTALGVATERVGR